MIHREDHNGGVAVLRMEHGKANAVDAELFTELGEQLDALKSGDNARAVVLTGTGSIFSAGVNLFKVAEGGPEYVSKFLPLLNERIRQLLEFPLPVVAAVNGHAIAGGAVLALACDRRVTADGKGRFGLTELLVGVPFPAAALEAVRAAVSGAVLHDLVLTGKTVLPDEALRLGLVDEVVDADALLENAVKTAAAMGRIPRDAFALTKEHLRAPVLERIDRYAPSIDERVLAVWSKPESMERIRAFLEATVGKK